jgi:1L-myo-inositol 1-phosphate cytidylyltransferase
MAGRGSRLGFGDALPKPLVPILGRPLAFYIIEALHQAGVRDLHVIVGANGEALVSGLRPLIPPPMRLHPITNPAWQKQNGLSALCAEGKVKAPFFLTMGDHLFDPILLDRLMEQSDPALLNVALDRKLDAIFDLADAMKVRTRGGKILAIGKVLANYNAIDTGVFLCPNELFECLRQAQVDGDCSLADGVRLMAGAGKAAAIDIGDAWWQDVDTPAMLERAEESLPEALRREVRPERSLAGE